MLGVLASLAISVPTPSRAQQTAEAIAAGVTAWGRGGCSNCHGGIGLGGGGGEYPTGPNLWAADFGRDVLVETIACGRPVTGMPANLAGAYVTVPCYGMPVGTTLKDAGVEQGAGMSQEQIDALADFLFANVLNHRPVTRAKCAVFYGGNLEAPTCAKYPLE